MHFEKANLETTFFSFPNCPIDPNIFFKYVSQTVENYSLLYFECHF